MKPYVIKDVAIKSISFTDCDMTWANVRTLIRFIVQYNVENWLSDVLNNQYEKVIIFLKAEHAIKCKHRRQVFNMTDSY